MALHKLANFSTTAAGFRAYYLQKDGKERTGSTPGYGLF